MPIYEYKCLECDHTFEKLVFKHDGEKIECPKCKKKHTKKLISSVSIGNNAGSGCAPGAPSGFS